ncbi:MAG: hypothetical protein GY792_08765 [Gammaproteobacteria bacterium]|nr:hypothetical protein [Gammaproteobacteria bacterium]
MKNSENSDSATEIQTLPYIYGRQSNTITTSDEQRIDLSPPGPEYAPELEDLKVNDPDSYRMVIYSWG